MRWLVGDAETLPFAAAMFDAVLCRQSVQFFADRARAVREMRRVLVPGGRCALNGARSLLDTWIGEHHFDRYICPAPQIVAASIAQYTTTMLIGTAIVLLPHHNPIRLAVRRIRTLLLG
jgi:ubiquinone/menaquinone biosynthesis C-methylase UbiE